MDRWISVKERFPTDEEKRKHKYCAGYSEKTHKVSICETAVLEKYVMEYGNYDDTTHWVLVPELP